VPVPYEDDAPVRPETYYYHPDHLGSTSWVTDQNARVHEHVEYFPYGGVWRDPRSDSDGGPVKAQSLLFTAKELDEETGLYYFGARYYSPRTGRWLSPDPVLTEHDGDPQEVGLGRGHGSTLGPIGLSPYAYAAHSPTVLTDPDGRIVWMPVLLAAWAVYEVGSAVYDGYNAYKTLRDPNATKAQKTIAVAGFGASIIAPGGGYGTAGRLGAEVVEEGLEQGAKLGVRQATATTARVATSAFSKLQYASKYGFGGYGALRYKLQKAGVKGLQVHHLIEQRFAKVLKQDPNKMLSLVLDPAEHQKFTNAWRALIPHGNGTKSATPQQIMDAARKVYKDYPEVLKALGL
jgi:RHS repeat-associated protein